MKNFFLPQAILRKGGDFLCYEYYAYKEVLKIDYELLKNGNVKVGEDFIPISCNSTKGIININDLKGNLILFSYPEDFYYISEIEIIELQKNIDEFNKRDTKIILIGYGNMLSHYAWINSMKFKTNIDITIPLLEDKIGEIARRYGMVSTLNNNQITNKVIFVGKDKIIKAIIEYESSIPRNIYEIIRILDFINQNEKKLYKNNS